LNFEKFVAKRLHTESNLQHSISKPILKMAVAAVSLSITVMILAIATGKGLQEKISAKVTGFTSDIQVTVLDLNQSLELSPISPDSTVIMSLYEIEGVEHVQTQISKNALIKTDTEFEGIVVKGVDNNFDWSFINTHLTQGQLPKYNSYEKSNEILISKKLSQTLGIEINDQALFYFQGKQKSQPLIRKFTIKGIYETGIEIFDDLYIFADLKHLQKINRWSENQFSSIEIKVNKDYNIDAIQSLVEIVTPFDTKVSSSKSLYPQIFDWIKLFDLNIAIILIIMIVVASINMISSLLIIILERTKMIGLLKALGAASISIKKIFLYHAFYLLQKGLIIGNGIGLSLIALQHFLAPIQLDPAHYYVKKLPVILSIENWLSINLMSFFVCMVLLIIPALIIQKVEPVKAIRYE
jgi:lipoprotein-releasing system permease protein